jgi:hypothetical protein
MGRKQTRLTVMPNEKHGMHYAERQAFRVHGEALAEIYRMLKDGSKWQ